MSVGDRYLRLWERLGAVLGYIVIVVACAPFTIQSTGIAHLAAVLIALHLASSAGRRAARGWGQRRALSALTDPATDPGLMARVAGWSDPQQLVHAIARLPEPARGRWLAAAGALPHRCGTTVRAEVERQGAAVGDAGIEAMGSLAGRLEWSAHRTRLRLLALTPDAIWVVITVTALASWPTLGQGWFLALVAGFCLIGLVGMTAFAVVDEARGHRAAVTPQAATL